MKYEVGFVIPDLLDYITKNNLHVFNVNIRLRSIYDYGMEQMLMYAALRKNVLSRDNLDKVTLKK